MKAPLGSSREMRSLSSVSSASICGPSSWRTRSRELTWPT